MERFYGRTRDEAELRIRAAICTQKAAHTAWKAERDLRHFDGTEVCP